MASFEIIGKYGGSTPTEEIKEGFSKRIFKLETDDQFSPTLVFELHKTKKKDNTGLIAPFAIGDELKVYFNLQSKESNGRWFHNVVAWKLEVLEQSNQGTYNNPPPTESQFS